MQSIDWFDPNNEVEKAREKDRQLREQNERLQLAFIEAQQARRQAAIDMQRRIAEDISVPFDEMDQRIIERDGKKYKQQRWELLYSDPVAYVYEEEEIPYEEKEITSDSEEDFNDELKRYIS